MVRDDGRADHSGLVSGVIVAGQSLTDARRETGIREMTLTVSPARRAQLAVTLLFVVALAVPAAPAAAGPFIDVIVQAPQAEAAAAALVQRMGGTVTAPLPIVSGFAARVPASAESALSAAPGVRAVTRDVTLRPTRATRPSKSTVASVYRQEIGATNLAKKGYTGAGIRVALIDTGVDEQVAATGDLAGRVVPVDDPAYIPPLLGLVDPPDVPCANFSGEATCDDTFGHGTFMAGLIAGDGKASKGKFAGVAPRAEIVSVKVGGADGSADVSKVLAGLQWVVSFREQYNIRVLNLSLGTDSTAPPSIDPLNLAVRRAWVAGITVVASAGNVGEPEPGAPYGTVTKPGDDPYVITVGAVDDVETANVNDDRLPAFTSHGPTAHGDAKPDVVAPGARLVSLRAPGSFIEGQPGLVNDHYRRGSGTSMSAAVVSGLAAQLLQARPAWLPDDVKAALRAGAVDVASTDVNAVGEGLVSGPAALSATINPTYRTAVDATGLGLLEDSRGGLQVCLEDGFETILGCPELLVGELTAQGRNWQGVQYAATQWTADTWYLSQWATDPQGRNWQATSWVEGRNWQGRNWQGSSFYGDEQPTDYGNPIDGSIAHGVWGP